MVKRRSSPATKKSAKTKAVTKALTKSRKSKTKTKKSKAANNNFAQSYYRSEVSSFTSNPESGEPYGKVVTVTMKNGEGEKTEQILNKNGKPVNTSKSRIQEPIRIRVRTPVLSPGLFGAFGF
jgi:hypothetical protein